MATDIVTLFNKLDEVVFEFTKHVVRTYADKQKQPDMYDEFDMDDFRVFMKSIPGGSKEMLKKIFDDLPQFVVNKTFKCTNKVKVETKMDAAAIHAATTVDAPKLPEFKLCGHEQTVQIEGIFNFFL